MDLISYISKPDSNLDLREKKSSVHPFLFNTEII